jgi:hypothetical protein
MVSVSKTAESLSMSNVVELLLAGNRAALEADSEAVATPKLCLHVLLGAQADSLLPLALVETSVAASAAALGAIVVGSVVDSVAAIAEDMVVDEGGSDTKEEEALEEAGGVVMVEHPMALVMARHPLPTHLLVLVEPEADSLVGMAVAATADHQLTAA